MNKKFLFICMLFFFQLFNFVQASHPKREFRGTWIASVANLDWPNTYSVSGQKATLLTMLDDLKEAGINAVIFQVRPECDALYQSEYEPWSYWLTGEQGRAPDPWYDPLELAIEEAHKRGMELHAWFNPYRAERIMNDYPLAENHIARVHPEWTFIKWNSDREYYLRMLDPGIPMVRDYVTNVIMDVVTRYDVDGVHFDDYFYPYEGMNNEDDQSTWDSYRRGFSDRGDWRRDNVNLLVAQVHDSIQAVKPNVKFGISPFGIWKYNVPEGIKGMSSYYQIYCDPTAWLNAQTVDYINPQLYWEFDGSQDYGKLLPWWAERTKGRHLYSGNASYRITDYNWAADELPRQIRLNRQTANCYGEVFFRATYGVTNNPKGFADSLKNNYYKYPALIPQMSWKDGINPNVPANIRFEPLVDKGPATLRWDVPNTAVDGDSARFYVVYHFSDPNAAQQDLLKAENILTVLGEKNYFSTLQEGGYYAVTALDANNNESELSGSITISPPENPALALPLNAAANLSDTVDLKWHYQELASSYQLQIAEDSTFNHLKKDLSGIQDTVLTETNFKGQQEYFWRVAAANPGGISDFSDYFKFRTGFPVPPELVSPLHATLKVPTDTVIVWNESDAATQYRVQVAYYASFVPAFTIIDTTINQDTSFVLTDLQTNKTHYWRIQAINEYGKSGWSEAWGFKTYDPAYIADNGFSPVEYDLKQNYPNPFNPFTTIEYSIPQAGRVEINLYDIQGRLIRKLVEQDLTQGRYSINFDGSNLASGVYFYQIRAGRFIKTRKMILVR